jgi:murein L,D-transpeptidase YcbB/YkuD
VQWLRFSANYFPLLLRQREGPDNALGVIKFMFDNPYSVYLHDTNNRELFRRDRRAFSHGCVRVENAIALAHYLVTGKPNFKSKQVDKYLEQKQAHQINLQAPIAIYIRYFTCAYENNVFKEFNDVYGLDNDIEELLCKSGDLTNW